MHQHAFLRHILRVLRCKSVAKCDTIKVILVMGSPCILSLEISLLILRLVNIFLSCIWGTMQGFLEEVFSICSYFPDLKSCKYNMINVLLVITYFVRISVAMLSIPRLDD